MSIHVTPLIFELNARVHGRRFDDITQSDLAYFRRLGFTHLWMMGVWRISEGAIKISKRFAKDFEGSPYAVPSYEFNPRLGDDDSFLRLRERARREGLRLVLDFVPNHMAFDAPLVDEHPDFFITHDPSARDEEENWYYTSAGGNIIAHGRDPYFAPWIDTAQLDYSNPELREYMTDIVCRLARLTDGVRCDMAMLLLREQVKNQWYPRRTWEWFNDRLPDEFWRGAIESARKINPEFLFIAEAYWGKEAYLQELGFDYTYNKTLYDRVVGRGWEMLVDYLEMTSHDFLARSVHFIENHDEERAQHVFGPDLHRRAAALIVTLPGAPLIHQGQMEGMREKLPVQRIKPREANANDRGLLEFYERILSVGADPVFRAGRFHPFDSGVHGLVTFIREYRRRRIVVAIDFREGRGVEAARGHLSIPGALFPELKPGEYRLRDLWTNAFQHPAQLETTRMVVDLDQTRNPDHPFYLLEIVI